jgi:tRNA modification GTPase
LTTSAFTSKEDTIVALATPPGVSAIAVIRLSGSKAIDICQKLFYGKDLSLQPSHTIHLGTIRDEEKIIDEVVVSLFKAPNSFTKEDIVEVSCHGSDYIIKKLLQIFIKYGARLARPGEFTKRAFLNGRFDLAQAEAVADIIASDSEAAQQTAMNQMRGGFSKEIRKLRDELVHFASMVELELDFSEEDVEFANREQLKDLLLGIKKGIEHLLASFSLGNAIKNGIPTVIAGKPNAGKSTLLNILLNEDKAIVSEIAGTTRDFIEDEINLGGFNFRFIDTAGLRETKDKLESLGIERTRMKMKQASLIIYMFDVNNTSEKELVKNLEELKDLNVSYIVVGNKIDLDRNNKDTLRNFDGIVRISAANNIGIEELKDKILEQANVKSFRPGNAVVTNLRHFESLTNTLESLDRALSGLDKGITSDFLAQDIRHSLHHLGEITGEITTDDLLDNIFSKFCIGK